MKLKNIQCGEWFTIYLTQKGLLYKSGSIYEEEEEYLIPTLLSFFTLSDPVITHSAGNQHYFCLTKSNKLYSMGWGEYGQLGHENNNDLNEFKEIKFFNKLNSKIRQISCGDNHSYVLLSNYELYSFGRNRWGQLGIGRIEEGRNIPQKVNDLKFISIFGYGGSGIGIDLNNKLFVVGYNEYGQLGLGNTKDQLKFIQNKFVTKNNKKKITIKHNDNDSIEQNSGINMFKKLIKNGFKSFFDVYININ